MKLSYYSTSEPDILSIAEKVEYDLFTMVLYFKTISMYYNHTGTYENDLSCIITSEIVSDLADH